MSNCYFCGIELNKTNSSNEHIIPNALGGKLKGRFLCKSCNSSFGSSHDADLAKSLELFSLLVNPSRDRGEVQPVKMKMGNTEVTLGTNLEIKPQIQAFKINEERFRIVAHGADLNKMENIILKRIMKMYKGKSIPQEKLTEYKQAIKASHHTIEHPLLEVSLFTTPIFPALLKIALNYAIYNNISTKFLVEPLELLKKNLPCRSRVRFYYPDNISNDETHPVHHHLVLFGDPKSKLLYCLISLYGCFDVFVLLSAHYTGNTIFHSYGYDLLDEEDYDIGKIPPLDEHVIKELNTPSSLIHQTQFTNFKKAIDCFLQFFTIPKNYEKLIDQLTDSYALHLIIVSQNIGQSTERTLTKEQFIARIKINLKSYLAQYLKPCIFIYRLLDVLRIQNIADYLYNIYLIERISFQFALHVREYQEGKLIKNAKLGVNSDEITRELLDRFFCRFTTQDPEYSLIRELSQENEVVTQIKNNLDLFLQYISNLQK